MRLERLDVIRGIAVLGVVLVHSPAIGATQYSEVTPGWVPAVETLLAAGRFGVELFFVLSGFLIAWIYGGSQFSLREFMKARFARIWPLWAIFSLIWFLTYFVVEGHVRFEALIQSFFFALFTSPQNFDNFIGGAWSIQIEVACYLIFAVSRRWTTNKLVMLAIVINVLGSMTSYVALDGAGVFESFRRLNLQTGFNFFLLGWISARILIAVKDNAGGVSAEIKKLNKAHLSLWIATFLVTPAIYGNPIEAAGFVALMVALAFIIPLQNSVGKILSWFGRYSYFIFFAHFVIFYFLTRFLNESGLLIESAMLSISSKLVIFLACLAVCAPLAFVSMKFVERPLMRIIKS